MKQRIKINESQLRNLIVKAIRESLDNEMRAFHGSSARFNKFDSLYNGSGEGSASFGPGHYFTSSKQIGRDYATDHGTNQKEVGRIEYKYGDGDSYTQALELYKHLDNLIYIEEYDETNSYIVYNTIIKAFTDGLSKKDAIRNIYQQLIKVVKSKEDYEGAEDEWYNLKLRKAVNMLNSDIIETTRTLYKVDIPEDDKYADWNMKVPQRWIDFILSCFDEDDKETFREIYNEYLQDGAITIEKLYYILNNMRYDATYGNNVFKGTLKRFGYVGVKYPSGTHYQTSSTKQGDMNYTVFDDNNIKITNRWDL